MRGTVSFHPVELEWYDTIVAPLLAGEKVNPASFIDRCLRLRRSACATGAYKLALESLLERLQPPPPPSEGTVWEKVRSRLERFDFKPDPLAKRVGEALDVNVHLHGRPFLITEGSADRVATLVDEYLEADGANALDALIREQLVRLDRRLPVEIELVESGPASADMVYRRELLDLLKTLYDLARTARNGEMWAVPDGSREPAVERLPRDLPWLAVFLHSRAVPFWIGRDVDGLETVCRAAGVEPPEMLTPAWRLFSAACEEFPGLRESLGFELKEARDVGAFVSPADVPSLLSFLGAQGSRIIQAATQQGEGTACAALLRKIRECAQYAERHDMGYLEASGILPVEQPAVDDPDYPVTF